ncbi:putative disks large-like protein [Cricetulus griseus]|uniref:Putative disks large-like protein n=1 Tax=Cricetulus griseus TaxID=10029 RepID=A0A061IH61_CRIGR|nr:putative disks large-like protein [Cricetulus griseus]
MEKLEELSFKLRSKNYERIELSTIIANYTKKNLNNRLNSFEMMKREHKQVMSDLQILPLEISDSLNKCKQLIEENESYSYLHSLILRDLTQVKNNVHMLRMEKRKLWEEQIALQETCEEVKRLFKEVQEKICDPCAEYHQEEESLDERLKNLLKQEELITQHRELAEKMEHCFSVLEMRSEPKSGGALRTM